MYGHISADKVAVFMSMSKYVKVDEQYGIDEHIIDTEKKAPIERSVFPVVGAEEVTESVHFCFLLRRVS